MTGQDLLDTMEILDPELQLQAGEAGVVKGLLALNVAQDHFESLLAEIPGGMSTGEGNASAPFAIDSGSEFTDIPDSLGLLRLDRIIMLNDAQDADYTLTPLYNVGEYKGRGSLLGVGNAAGKPTAYWADGTFLYFTPTPDAAYNIRIHGCFAQVDITAAGVFKYKDIARLPMAVFAVKLISIGLDDPQGDLMEFAKETFAPVLKAYEKFRRETGKGFQYRYSHDT